MKIRGDGRLKRWIVGLFSVLTVAKFVIAGQLDLFGDEAFYWQCAGRPDVAYVDHPFMTAMLVKLGTAMLGETSLGVRLCFLIAGTALPWVIYHLAVPLVGLKDAWLAAAVSMALPGLAYTGLLAIPDMMLLLLAACYLATFERATRTGNVSFWILTGVFCALGLATHYRFILLPVAAGAYLVLTAKGRGFWRQGRCWVAWIIGALGLLPAVIYNARYHFEPIRYYLTVRNQTRFRLSEFLEFFGEQMAVVTPLMFAALAAALFSLFKRAKAGDDRCRLMLFFAVIPIGVFLLASPLKDTGAQTMHWPVPGYIPLLVFLPGLARSFLARGRSKWRPVLVAATPGLGLLVITTVFLELGTGMLQLPGLRQPFGGWQEVAEHTKEHLQKGAFKAPYLVVADHYKLGAQLEFKLGDQVEVYILNHSKNFEHGRQAQFDRWGIGEEALRKHHGRQALLVVEWSELPDGTQPRWTKHLQWFFEPLESLSSLSVSATGIPEEDRLLEFYRGTVIPKR